MSPLTAWVHAAITIARADVTERGFALPRACFVFACAPSITAWPARPRDLTPDQADDWTLQQLVGGRLRIAEAVREHAPEHLPKGARMICTSMDRLPAGVRADTVVGLHVEVWDPAARVCELHGVLPYVVRGGVPELINPIIPVEPSGAIAKDPNPKETTSWMKLN